MAKPYDSTLKELLDRHAAEWVMWLSPQLGIPVGPLEAINADLATVQLTADKVFRLPANAGLLHLEVQSSWDGTLPDRLLTYNVMLYDRYKSPVRSLVILLRQHANANNLTGVVERFRHRFEYDIVRVWTLSADTMLAGPLGLAPLCLVTDDAVGRLPQLVKQLAAKVEHAPIAQSARDWLLTCGYILGGLRYDTSVLRQVFEGVQHMKESSTYQAILNEGFERGLATGRQEGHHEGQVESAQLMLIAALEQRFGSIPKDLESRIRVTTDREQLLAAFRRSLAVDSLAAFTL